MNEIQENITITREELADRVQQYQVDGYRLAQICCTRLENTLEMNYSFDKAGKYVNLRIVLPCEDLALPSISKIFWAATFYENEIHDLFGLKISDMAVDYKGSFYKLAVKFPFGCPPERNKVK
jgi:ech hydrogenase subunit D